MLIPLKIFDNRIEAEMAQSLLESCEIFSEIQVDDMGGMRPALAFTSGVKLMAQQTDFEKAMQILNRTC